MLLHCGGAIVPFTKTLVKKVFYKNLFMKDAQKANAASDVQEKKQDLSRRKFLTFAGGIAGASALIAACNKDDEGPSAPTDGTTDIGSNDRGLMNLAFAMQQIEAAFYEKVLASEYVGMRQDERDMMTYIRNQEYAQREFLRNHLQERGTELVPEFTNVKFSDRNSVMENAQIIENMVVAGMNGIAVRLFDSNNITMVLKMCSVEARQASVISDMILAGTFDSTTDINGLDATIPPNNAINIANRYLQTKISGNNLPS